MRGGAGESESVLTGRRAGWGRECEVVRERSRDARHFSSIKRPLSPSRGARNPINDRRVRAVRDERSPLKIIRPMLAHPDDPGKPIGPGRRGHRFAAESLEDPGLLGGAGRGLVRMGIGPFGGQDQGTQRSGPRSVGRLPCVRGSARSGPASSPLIISVPYSRSARRRGDQILAAGDRPVAVDRARLLVQERAGDRTK